MSVEDRIQYELQALKKMTEAEICRLYNVDSKEEACEGIIEYWRFIA